MKPLREDPSAPRELAELLNKAREVPEFEASEQAAVWRRINETADRKRVQRQKFNPWIVLVPAAAFAATVVIVPRLTSSPASQNAPTQLASVDPHVGFAPGSSTAVASDGTVTLRSGQITARAGAHVRTPTLDIVVQSARCTIQVAGEVTTIDVQDGQLRVRRGDGPEVLLEGATRFRSDDPRLAPPPATQNPAQPQVAPAPIADACAALASASKRSCYDQLSRGSDLAAQNAAYMLGQMDRDAHQLAAAVNDWSAYQQRFPDGVLWPEAEAGILTAKLEQSDWSGALSAADAYLARVGSGGRAPEVQLIRANLLREHLNRPREALDAYRALAKSAPDSIRSEALFGEALAATKLGESSEAHDALEAYAREFPAGAHAAEVARMRGP